MISYVSEASKNSLLKLDRWYFRLPKTCPDMNSDLYQEVDHTTVTIVVMRLGEFNHFILNVTYAFGRIVNDHWVGTCSSSSSSEFLMCEHACGPNNLTSVLQLQLCVWAN